MNTFNEVIERYAAQIRTADVIEIADIPTIDLYMDQVTTFMDKGLARYKRNETDKILTKTMINNYTKAKIFPPPVKKKYSRTHLMLLIMIYHLKAILSIKDIGVLFHVALAEPDAEKQAQQIETIYAGFVALQKSTYAYLAIWRKIRQMTPSMGRILCLAARTESCGGFFWFWDLSFARIRKSSWQSMRWMPIFK